jgi:ornithine cyclodeaminase
VLVRLISERLIEELMPVELAIESAAEAFCAHSGGRAQVPLRSEIHRDRPKSTVLVMPGIVGDEVLGLKLIGSVVDPDDPRGKRTTCMILIWDARTFAVRGMIAADGLNEHRTAAGLAVATRALSRPDSAVHTLIGAGKLSFTTLLYISAVRPIERVFLLSRSPAKVGALAERAARTPRLQGVEIIAGADPEEAIRRADIVTTVTTSEVPVFNGAAVRPGTHINLGGAFRPNQREMDDDVARRGSFWLDDEESCRRRSGDVAIPLAAGVIGERQIRGEIGAQLLGRVPGRQGSDEITVFKSLGIATQDLVLGARLMDLAETNNLGRLYDEVND